MNGVTLLVARTSVRFNNKRNTVPKYVADLFGDRQYYYYDTIFLRRCRLQIPAFDLTMEKYYTEVLSVVERWCIVICGSNSGTQTPPICCGYRYCSCVRHRGHLDMVFPSRQSTWSFVKKQSGGDRRMNTSSPLRPCGALFFFHQSRFLKVIV